MIFNTWKTAYFRTFHQLRAIALLSLIFSHALTFVNFTLKQPLESLAVYPFIRFFSPFGVFFVAFAGVTYRLSLSHELTHSRLHRWPASNIPLYLAALIAIDAVKNYFVYGTFIYFVHWDFLKTLLLAYFLIVLLARIHVVAVGIASLLFILGADFIRAWLRPKLIFSSQITDELIGWNTIHTQALFISALLLIAASRVAFAWKISRPRQVLLFFILIPVCLVPLVWALNFRPTLYTYVQMHNWLINGILGETKDSHLYSGLAWVPTVFNAFFLTHLALKLREYFERWSRQAAIASLGFSILAYLIYAPQLPEAPGEILIWNLPAFSDVSLMGELFKIASIANVFILVALMNRRWRTPPFEEGLIHFSRASFFIYLLCTSLSPMMAPYCAANFGLAGGTLLNFSVTLAASILVAEGGSWFSRKRLRFTVYSVSTH